MPTYDMKLDKRLLSQSRVIAAGRGIRDVNRLLRQYGGKAKHWVKKAVRLL